MNRNLNNFPMKINIKYLLTIMLASGLLLSCSKDNPDYPGGSGSMDGDGVGFLSFSKLNVIAEESMTEDFNDKNQRSVTKATRAVDLNPFIIKVLNDEDAVVYTSTYQEVLAATKGVELEIGTYTVVAMSAGDIPLTAWDTPTFYGERSVVIKKNETTKISNLVCEISNIKTTVELSADLKDMFRPDKEATTPMAVTLKLGENSLVYNRTETRSGFFKAVNDNNTIELTLSGEYNTAAADATPVYESLAWTQTIPNVKAGQWRKINIKVDNSNSGNVRFVVTVETWTYEDEIDVRVVGFYSISKNEEEIEDPFDTTTDPGSAVLTLGGGYNISSPVNVDKTTFIMETNSCTKPIFMYATPVSGATVTKVEIFDIESDNQSLLNAVGDKKIQLYPNNEQSSYNVVSVGDNKEIKCIATNNGMFKLYSYAGTHKITVKTIDSEGRKSFTTFTVNVSADALPSTGPEVTWRGGKEFGTVYNAADLDAATGLIIDIASSTGLTKFKVSIKGEVVNVDALTTVGLTRDLDLINPGDQETILTDQMIGFPVKDDVAGKTELEFNISRFGGMMPALVKETGVVTFELTVGDASGDVTKEIKLNVVY